MTFFLLHDRTTVDHGTAPEGATIIDPRGNAPFHRRALTAAALAAVLRLHAEWTASRWNAVPVGIRANLSHARLVGANLDGANLARASLVGANLDGANLDGASLVGANLVGANLARANLDGASLVGANLVGANLARASLVGANLVGANLVGANLDGANLDGASLARANLARANLARANLDGASLVDGRSWDDYRGDHLAGLCSEPEIVAKVVAAWGNHEWKNCPMHGAHGWSSLNDAPESVRLLAACWVALYDAKLLESPRTIALRKAAPDMLALLKAIVADQDMARDEEEAATIRGEHVDAIRAVVAKAEGRIL